MMYYHIKLHPEAARFLRSRRVVLSDPAAMPMLDYFTRKCGKRISSIRRNKWWRAVVATIVGCEFIMARPVVPATPV